MHLLTERSDRSGEEARRTAFSTPPGLLRLDTVKDGYGAAAPLGSIGVFSAWAAFSTASAASLRRTVTGRSAAPSVYDLSLDRIMFVS